MNVNEYKVAIGLRGDKNLNVFFANWTDESLLGVATLPWERTVFSVDGIYLQVQFYYYNGN